ncbi:MAG: hypothetical protein IPO26_07580 [Saprospiraceae bacterium]|nr:hypothetical protein [Saprospiraceae bacterium]
MIWTDANGNQVGNGTSISVTTHGTYFFEVINTTNNCSSGKDKVIVTEDKNYLRQLLLQKQVISWIV